MKLYFFTSTDKRDKVNVITIGTTSVRRAKLLVSIKFLEWGYKGVPKMLAV